MDETNNSIIFEINGEDVITSVSQNWDTFITENGGGCIAKEVLGASLWNFITGEETQLLYQAVFHRVRNGKHIDPIPFRCDSPERRRYLELTISLLPNSGIKIVSRTLKTESRDPVRLLSTDAPRSRDTINICSLCKKIETAQDGWVEIEDQRISGEINQRTRMPNLNHQVCPACYYLVLNDLIRAKPPITPK